VKRLAGWQAPEGVMRYGPPASTEALSRGSVLRRFGYVMDVAGPRVRLWINGATDDFGVWIDTPASMPGYLLRAGATFDVTDYDGGWDTARYQLQAHSYEDT
jgi:hypothetical protein